MKRIYLLGLLICILCAMSSCAKKSITGVNLTIKGYEELLGGDKSSLVTESIYGHLSYDKEYNYTCSSCLKNVTIVSGNKKFTKEEIEHYSQAQNDSTITPFYWGETNIVVLSSRGDTLLKYINVGGQNEVEIITYAKLYTRFSDKSTNPMIMRAKGELNEDTMGYELGAGGGYYLAPMMKWEYEELDGSTSQVYCKKEIEVNSLGTTIGETWFYPNGAKKEYKGYDDSQKKKIHKYYDDDNKNSSSSSTQSNQYDDSSIKWKEFAGTTYRASQFTSEGYQYYAFSYDRTGNGKYIIWWNYLGTDVVEDKMEFSIYKVESEGNYLYLYTYELNDPVKIQFQGNSLYTNTGDRYEIWR